MTSQREVARLTREFNRLTESAGIKISKPSDINRLKAIVDGMDAGTEHWNEVAKSAQENIDL